MRESKDEGVYVEGLSWYQVRTFLVSLFRLNKWQMFDFVSVSSGALCRVYAPVFEPRS